MPTFFLALLTVIVIVFTGSQAWLYQEDARVKTNEVFTKEHVFDSLSQKYCPEHLLNSVLVDEPHYLKLGPDPSQGMAGASLDYCEIRSFVNTEGKIVSIFVQHQTTTPMIAFSDSYFFALENGELTEISDQIEKLVDLDLLRQRGAASIEKHASWLIGEGLEMNLVAEVSSSEDMVSFNHYNTGESLYVLQWNGSEFVPVTR